MFIGIDGTGPVSDAKYSASMENSFVHRLWRMHSGPNKRYLRGPETLGCDDTLHRRFGDGVDPRVPRAE